jgi:hypothetical protein
MDIVGIEGDPVLVVHFIAVDVLDHDFGFADHHDIFIMDALENAAGDHAVDETLSRID